MNLHTIMPVIDWAKVDKEASTLVKAALNTPDPRVVMAKDFHDSFAVRAEVKSPATEDAGNTIEWNAEEFKAKWRYPTTEPKKAQPEAPKPVDVLAETKRMFR